MFSRVKHNEKQHLRNDPDKIINGLKIADVVHIEKCNIECLHYVRR